MGRYLFSFFRSSTRHPGESRCPIHKTSFVSPKIYRHPREGGDPAGLWGKMFEKRNVLQNFSEQTRCALQKIVARFKRGPRLRGDDG
jgi:hypothetical protein